MSFAGWLREFRLRWHANRKQGPVEGRRRRRKAIYPRIEPLDRKILLSAAEAASYNVIVPQWFDVVEHGPSDDAVGVANDGAAQSAKSEWIVRLTEEASAGLANVADSQRLLNSGRLTFQVKKGLGLPGLVLVEASGGTQVEVATALSVNSQVAYFEQNGDVVATAVPNDPLFPQQPELQRIGAAGAWDTQSGSSPLVVAVIDSGIDYTSPDLYLNIWLNQGEIPSSLRGTLRDADSDGLITFRDLNQSVNAAAISDLNHNGYIDAGDLLQNPFWMDHVDGDGNGKADDLIGWDFTGNDAVPFDDNGHGTHVSGILAATGNNAVGITGVNWNAQIMVVKFLDQKLHGEATDAVSALNYVTQFRQNYLDGQQYSPDVRITNNSWEIRPSQFSSAQSLNDAIAANASSGMLLVAAAGNGVGEVPQNLDTDPFASLPAANPSPNIVSVAAVDATDQLLINSNYGATTVDLAAPGLDILSTEPGGNYGTRTGTSMATPFVTGAAALFWAHFPQATAAEVRQALLSGVDQVPGLAGKVASGGRLDIQNTLSFDTIAPRATLTSAPNITSTGATFEDIAVNYVDNVAVKFSTLNAADITVTRADGQQFNPTISLLSTTTTVNAALIGASYRVLAPSGKWTNADNGVYEIRWVASQVADSINNQNAAGLLGTFTINIPAPDDLRVTSLVDSIDKVIGDGRIEDTQGRATLRAAIQEANFDPDANTIKLPAGTFTLSIGGINEDSAATGDLDLSQNVTLIGASTASTIIDASLLDRVFHVLPGVTVTLKNLTLRGGKSTDGKGGGGILNEGFLTLDHVVVTNNTATSGGGGGILNNVTTASSSDTLTIIDSTISNNTAISADGGGLKVLKGKTSILESTFNNNTAGTAGGGVAILANTATATNSTFSANTAGTVGGGLQLSGGVLALTNTTITLNTANSAGGGLSRSGTGTARLINTIVAGNLLTGVGSDVDVSGAISATGSGNNLVGIIGTATGFSTSQGDLFGTMAVPLNANLASLADYGGVTRTHRPNIGSPVIDVGTTVAGLTADQRGLSRTVDGDNSGAAAIDIGAVEFVLFSTISGTVYYDVDQNAVRGLDEPALAGWTIYLDVNANHILDVGELSTVTGNDGKYTFTNVPPGNYFVAEVLPESSIQDGLPVITQVVEDFDSLATFTNAQPVANPQSSATITNVARGIVLTGDDGDPEVSQVITFVIIAGPSHGSLSGFNANTGSVIYTPALNYNGADSFQFTVTDDNTAGGVALTSNSATVTLNVNVVDYGDAPDTGAGTGIGNYQTLQTDNGPNHTINTTQTTLFLGSRVDADNFAVPNARANGDDITTLPHDEDGLVEPAQDLLLTVGTIPTVRLRATNTTGAAATLYGWIDYNRDGVFENATERASVAVPSGTNNGTFTLTFSAIPIGAAAGLTYARFRLSSDVAAANSTGAAVGGEVEDYPATITLRSDSTVDSTLTVKISSSAKGGPALSDQDFFGRAAASLGDLDGDGVTDLAVSAAFDDTGGANCGAVYVQFMNANGTVKSSQKIASGLNGGPNLASGDLFGCSLASLGDLDGDGVTDLAVGAYLDDQVGMDRGAVYVLLLNANGTVKSSVKLAGGLNGGPALADSDFFGSSIATVGDLNGDGVTDVAIGVYKDDTGGSDRGAVYVLLLNANGTAKSSVKIASGTNGGPTLSDGDAFGFSAASMGDLNGDGVTDLAIGAQLDDTGGNARGAIYILLLNANGTVKSSSKIANGLNGGPALANGDRFGNSMASVGDVDGDGVTDLAIGAYFDNTRSGAIYVQLMNANGTAKSSVKIAGGVNGGPALANYDDFGNSVASLGDLDGDGVNELAVGADLDSSVGTQRGAVYILHLIRFAVSDFGDAPDTSAGTRTGDYQTLLANGGTSHDITTTSSTLFLGAHVDAENNGNPSTSANGDDRTNSPDDEDGLIEPAQDLLLTVGTVPTVRLRATNTTGAAATLYGWIDYNRDGVFDNATERASVAVPSGTNNGTFTLSFPVIPIGAATGVTYARFRLSSDVAAANSTGAAIGGEVEDYPATITFHGDGTVDNTKTKKIASSLNGGPALSDQDFFGRAAASLGDLDGDGVTDLAVSAAFDDTGGANRGAVYVQFMNANGTVKSSQEIASGLNGGPNLANGDLFGCSLASLGDLDGDGVTDLAVGAYLDDQVGVDRGAVYVLLLNANGTVKSRVKLAGGLNGGPALADSEFFGSSIATVGDLNGDGVTDVAIGVYKDDTGGSDRGAVYVLLLNANGTAKSSVKIASGTNGGPTLSDGDAFGFSAASMGDLNGDGVTDLAIGAQLDDTGGNARGAIYILLLNANGTVKSSSKIANGLNGGPALANGDRFGNSMASVGDVDGDGVTDLAIGAYFDNTRRGAIYVQLMNANGTAKSSMKIAGGTNGGPTLANYDDFGNSVASLGDLNGDGMTDLAVGAAIDSTGGTQRGAIYILSLKPLFTSDFGDAPDTSSVTGPGNYQTLLVNGGPSHDITTTKSTLFLGAHVDAENNGNPSTSANGDDRTNSPDDEDGLIEPAQDLLLTVGTVPTVRVRATNTTGAAATLYGWIDYNRDGVFDNVTERASVTVLSGTNNGTFTLTFSAIPFGATAGATYARFRLSTDVAAANSTGAAIGGEVEDYSATMVLRTDGTADAAKTVKLASGMNGSPTLVNSDRFGSSVASLGDVDGDGVIDLAVGSRGENSGRGAVYVQFMNSNGTVKSNVRIGDGTNGGPSLAVTDYFGTSVTSLGDLDGDGVTDLAVGAHSDDTGGGLNADRGTVYVLFLNSNGTVKSRVKIASGMNGGPVLADADRFGWSVTSLGDLNGDGVTDLAVGAFGDDTGGNYRGAAYVLLLNSDGTAKSNLKIASGLNGGPTLANGDYFGRSVASLGDLDGDGITDLAVGSMLDDTVGTNRGAVDVLFLNANGTVKNSVKIASGISGGPTLGDSDFFGSGVAAVGDLDGDGVTDLVVGAYGDNTGGTDRGAIQMLLLNSNGTVKSSLKLTSGVNGGPTLADFDNFGWSVSSLGDLDGDSLTDLAVGAVKDDTNGTDRGAVQVLFLKPLNANAPVFTSTSAPSIAENSTGILTVTATDADLPSLGVTFSLTGGADLGKFAISSAGVLTFLAAPNFESPTDANSDNVYVVQVTANDGAGRTTTQSLLVTVNDANDAPTDFVLSSSSLAENNVPQASVGTLRAIDPDFSNTFSFSIVAGAGGTDNSSFTLVSNVLTITPVTNRTTKSSYAIRMRVTDQGGMSFEKPFTIDILPAGTGLSPSAPGVPAAWSISGNVPWITVTGGSSSAPNHAFIPDSAFTSDSSLTSLAITVTKQDMQLKFQNNYVTESGHDGGVLEVAINGGSFTDIVTAGGSFVSGGYNSTMSVGRNGWTGNSGGYTTTLITLPAFDIGSSIQFRWRFLSDSNTGQTGWNIDSIQLFGKQPSWQRTSPTQAIPVLGGYALSLAAGSIIGGQDFGNFPQSGEIHGREFLDADGDGKQGAGEVAVQGRTVFLDANGNGLLDSGEKSTVTDANGDYAFTNVPAQLWQTVVSLSPMGWESTTNPATMNLSGLLAANGGTGREGTVFTGAASNNQSGANVRSAGDVNGDGFDDVLISAKVGGTGGAYVVFGSSLGWPANVSLANLNGTNGFAIQGVQITDNAGASVSSARDFNHDGFDDLLIGAPTTNRNGAASGTAYLIFGKAHGFSPTMQLSSLTGTDGFAINGNTAGQKFGSTVSGVGDVNHDGFDDVLISAPQATNAGAAFLIFGRDTSIAPFSPSFDLPTLNGTNGVRLNGVGLDHLGDSQSLGLGLQSIAPAGDVNHDGIDDLVIGAKSGTNAGDVVGNAYVVFGRPAAAWGATLNLASLDGTTGFAIRGAAQNDQLGISVSGAGDVNGDGIDDLVIGADYADTQGSDSGAAYIIFGKNQQVGTFPAEISVSSLNGTNGLRMSGVSGGDNTGISVSGAGDFNGDGLSDILIGADHADTNNIDLGSAFIVFGSRSSWPANFNLSNLDGRNGLRLNGIAIADLTGFSSAGVGDVNGDGLSDILVGAFQNDTAATDAGASFLLYGRADNRHRILLDAAEVRTGVDFHDRPLKGELQGRVFNDRDGDGVQDTSEEEVAGITLFLDANLNGNKDTGELTATTDANGLYVFSNLDAYTSVTVQSKTYRIVEFVDVDRLELVQSLPQKLLGAVDVTPFVVNAKFRAGFDISADGQGGFILSGTDGAAAGFDQQNVLRVTPDGQTVSFLAAADHPQGVTSDGTYAYWVDLNAESSQTRIYRQLLTSGERELVYSSLTPDSPTGSIVGASGLDLVSGTPGSLVTVDGFQGQVSKLVPQAGNMEGDVTQIGGTRSTGLIEQTHAQFLDVENGIVYIADPGYVAPGSDHSLDLPAKILSIPLAGGNYTTLYTGTLPAFSFSGATIPASRPQGISVHANKIYVTGDRGIYSLPITGGTPTLLAADERFQQLAELTWSNNALYVIDNGTRGLATVWRVDLQPQIQRSVAVDLSDTRSWDVVLTPGVHAAGLDFASYDPNAAVGASGAQSIRGFVFNDTNGNGIKDSGEAGRAGITVYLDLNHTGVLDDGDLTTVTLAGDDPTTTNRVEVAGEYVFNGQSAGLYDVLLADSNLERDLTSGRRVALAPGDLPLKDDWINLQGATQKGTTGTPRSVATGDWNKDGLNDLVIADAETGKVSIFKNIGDQRFTKVNELNVGGIPSSVTLVNLDGDSMPDLAIGRAQYGHVSLWKNLGNGAFQERKSSDGLPKALVLNSPNEADYGIPSTVVAADFNNDSRIDLAVADVQSGYNRVFVYLRNANDFSFAAPQILSTPGVATGLVAAKLNSTDQMLDLAATIPGTDQLLVWLNLNDSTGHLNSTPLATTVGDGPVALVAVQANGDAFPDLAIANQLGGTVVLLANDGVANWTTISTVALTAPPTGLVAADFDGRNGADLAVTLGDGSDSSQPLALLYHSGDNTNPYVQSVAYGASIFDFSGVKTSTGITVAVSNLDVDTDPDLIVVNSSGKSVSVLRNGPASGGQSVRLTTGGASANATDINFGILSRHAVSFNATTGNLTVTLLIPSDLEFGVRGTQLELRIQGVIDTNVNVAVADIRSITVQGSSGADRIDLSGVSAVTGFTHSGGVTTTLNGNAGNDTITGSRFADTISGGEGDNVLSGGSGPDNISAGTGNDLLFGGEGDDRLDGATGINYLDGGPGNNTLLGSQANLAPSFASGPSIRINEDAGIQMFPGWAVDISAGSTAESSQIVNFLVTNDNSALFSVAPAVSANGTLSFTPAVKANGIATVTVRLHDNGGIATGGSDTSVSESFTITVDPLNDTPTDISLSSTSIGENNPANATIGTFNGIDPDSGDTFAFSLVAGTGSTDNGSFSIVGNSLMITPVTNFEARNSYAIRIQVTDQGSLTFQKQFTINVTDANEAPTDLTLSSANLAENNAANATVGTLTGTDPDSGNTFTFSLVAGTGSKDNGSFSIVGNSLKLTHVADFETQDSYEIRVQVTDQGGLIFQKQFTINITNANDSPTNLTLSSTSLIENNAANATIGTLTATDPDSGNTFTFALNPGVGGTDNGSFSIVGNILKFIPVADFETKSSYAIRLQASDQGGLTFEKQFTINVTDANESPTDLTLSSTTIAEHNAANATVGTFTATDSDSGNTFTFSLVAGTGGADNSSFTIVDNALKIVPVTDFATKNSYSIRIQVADQGGLTYEKSLTINVTSVAIANRSPTDLSLSSASVVENNAASATVGTLSAIDPDAGNTFSFNLVAGAGSTDNANFRIVGNSVKITPIADFEFKSNYSIRVEVVDQGGLTFEKQFTINITDANEAPSNLTLSSTNIVESNAANATVGTLTATDPDSGSTFTFSLVVGIGSTDNASFTIVGNALKITSAADFEVKNSYVIRVQVADQGGLTFEKQMTIGVTDTNDSPANVTLSSTNIEENNLSNATVGTLTATDPDLGNTFTFTLVSGAGSTDNAGFAIAGSVLKLTSVTDFEAKNSYSIRVQVADQGGLTFEKQFTINVTDSNESPTNLTLSSTNIAENNAVNATVATFTATDPDLSNTFTFTLVSGTASTDNASFTIDGNALKITSVADFEAKNSYTVRVQVADQSGLTFEKPFTINVTDSNEAPTNLALSATSIADSNPANATVGTLTAADPDSGNTFTFSLVAGSGSADNSSFSISGNSLKIIPVTDAGSQNRYAIRVRVTDQDGLTFDKSFIINVTSTNVAPTDITLSATTIAENNAPNAKVGTFEGRDPDSGNTFTFSLVAGGGSADNSSFLISGNTLRIIPVTHIGTQSSYNIRVRVTDQDGLSFAKAFVITVFTSNVAPTDISLSATTISENNAPNATVGTLSGIDLDPDNTFTFNLVAGSGSTDNSQFSITGSTLKVIPVTNFAAQSSYQIRIRVTDQDGLSFEKSFAINVTRAIITNVAPTDISLSSTMIAENSSANSTIGMLSAIDPDAGNSFTFNLVAGVESTDNPSFLVTGNTLTIVAVADRETKSTYSIRIQVMDQGGLTFEKSFLINVTNVNEAPAISNIADQSILEDTATAILPFTIGDLDTPIGSLLVNATSSNTDLIPNGNIVISGSGASRTLLVTPAANQNGSATLTVTVSDGELITIDTFQVVVQPLDDPAAMSSTSPPLVYHVSSKKSATLDSTLTITDADTPTLMFAGSVLGISGQSTKDTLSILKQGGIGLKGKNVVFGSTVIGTVTGGKKGAALIVNLNGAATQNAVQALLRNIGFKSVDKVDGSRTLQIQITKLGGRDTNKVSRQILVSR